MTEFGSFDNSMRERVLALLGPSYLRLRKVVVERVTVIKFGVNDGSDNGNLANGIT